MGEWLITTTPRHSGCHQAAILVIASSIIPGPIDNQKLAENEQCR
jgi:hypothetical protein